MKTTQAHIERDQAQTARLPKLQPLKLEQLEGVAGGPNDSLPNRQPPLHCPDCVTN